MNFGAMKLEGLLGQENGAPSQVSEPETKTKVLGSGFSKQERSGPAEEDWRSSKMAKTDDISAPKAMPLHQGTSLLRSNSLASGGGRPQEHMLNFSALKSDISLLSSNIGLTEGSTQKTAFPYYQYTPSGYSRNVMVLEAWTEACMLCFLLQAATKVLGSPSLPAIVNTCKALTFGVLDLDRLALSLRMEA